MGELKRAAASKLTRAADESTQASIESKRAAPIGFAAQSERHPARAIKPKRTTAAGKLFTMMQACREANLSYQTLKFYCNQGLVPNVKRDKNNRRVFSEHDVEWIKSLVCLKKCGMSIEEMREYLDLCLQGEPSIPERKVMLAAKRERLVEQMTQIQESIDYIDWKQGFYDDVLAGRTEYFSNLLPSEGKEG